MIENIIIIWLAICPICHQEITSQQVYSVSIEGLQNIFPDDWGKSYKLVECPNDHIAVYAHAIKVIKKEKIYDSENGLPTNLMIETVLYEKGG